MNNNINCIPFYAVGMWGAALAYRHLHHKPSCEATKDPLKLIIKVNYLFSIIFSIICFCNDERSLIACIFTAIILPLPIVLLTYFGAFGIVLIREGLELLGLNSLQNLKTIKFTKVENWGSLFGRGCFFTFALLPAAGQRYAELQVFSICPSGISGLLILFIVIMIMVYLYDNNKKRVNNDNQN